VLRLPLAECCWFGDNSTAAAYLLYAPRDAVVAGAVDTAWPLVAAAGPGFRGAPVIALECLAACAAVQYSVMRLPLRRVLLVWGHSSAAASPHVFLGRSV
jgi:hypothetical protein